VHSVDASKCWDSELGHEDCLAAHSRSSGAQQQKIPTTITVQSIPRNDQLPLTGARQMFDIWKLPCSWLGSHLLYCSYSSLNLWRPLLPHVYIYNKASCASAVIWNFWHLGILTLSPERESSRMSKMTVGLTRCGTECFIAVPMWQQWTWEGYGLVDCDV